MRPSSPWLIVPAFLAALGALALLAWDAALIRQAFAPHPHHRSPIDAR